MKFKPSRVAAIVKKDLKKTIREPATLFLIILFPLMLTLSFAVSFGAVGSKEQATYSVGVLDLTPDSDQSSKAWSEKFVANLSEINAVKVARFANNRTAQDALSNGNIQCLVIIPENFGDSCESFVENPTNSSNWTTCKLQLCLDKGSMVAVDVIPPLVQQALVNTLVPEQQQAALPVGIGSEASVDAKKRSMFDYAAPGLFAFGALYFIMTVSQSFSVDREAGLLRRIGTTPVSSAEFMSAQVVSNMLLAVVQMIVIFASAFAVGYSPEADIYGIAMAGLIVAIFSLCCVGLGLITATIAKSPGAATGLSFIFLMPMMFLGTFVSSMMPTTFSETAGKIMPSYYVTDAITNLFLRGVSPTSALVLTDIAVVSASSIAVLIVGIFLFDRYGNR